MQSNEATNQCRKITKLSECTLERNDSLYTVQCTVHTLHINIIDNDIIFLFVVGCWCKWFWFTLNFKIQPIALIYCKEGNLCRKWDRPVDSTYLFLFSLKYLTTSVEGQNEYSLCWLHFKKIFNDHVCECVIFLC